MVAGQAQARYYYSGDWTNIFLVDGYGWWNIGDPYGLPGANDTVGDCVADMGGCSTVTLSTVAPLIRSFQFGRDESWYQIVNAGGVLTTTGSGGANSCVGSISTACIGRMTVNTGGQVIVTNALLVGNGTHGFVTNDGGNIRVTSHLWVGAQNNINGLVRITNGGVVNVGGTIGLGTINASTPSGGTGKVYVQDGGILNLTTILATNAIQPNSVMDISGSGQVIVPGDRTAVMSYYTNVGRITAYAGTGSVGIDYNNTNAGKTTLFAIVGYTPPTEDVWNPAANPSGTGKWSEDANWSSGHRPASVTKVTFNVVGAIPCTVTNAAVASDVVMGDNGPGGTLIITNGGSLTCGAGNPSVIGNNSDAVIVVENGASVTFGGQLHIGLNWACDGTLVMNGGTVSVAGMFDMGYQGGKGTAQIKGGTLNLSQFDDYASIQGESVLDVSGTGKVVINGDHQLAVNHYISTGQITNSSGAGLLVDYNFINVGKTTVYPVGLYLPPEQAVWNPALLNPSDTDGLWNVSSNWNVGMCPGDVTVVTFNVTDAIPCTVTNAAVARQVSMGNSGGPGGTLIITNGGSLTTGNGDWSAVGYSSNALMIVENGASASFGYHLWIGFDPGADGTLIMHGGTVSVGGMFGLGWNGGKGTADINGGTLYLSQWHPTDSIKGGSVLNITKGGTVVITGNYLTSISNFVYVGKITANGGPNVAYGCDSGANKTTLQVASPRQSVTSVAVSGGNTTLTCQTTAGHFYHLESTPSLSPATWTRVTGSTTNAAGASVTFTFPTSGDQRFYRTASP
jgi:hypothetical protein